MRVIYLADSWRHRLRSWLVENHNKDQCHVVYSCLNNDPDFSKFPDFDLGLNFLGSKKIPAPHCYKFVNFHPAPLPEYAGRNLAYQAIIGGSRWFGATIHYMDSDFDTGNVIEVVRFPIEPGDTAGDLSEKSQRCLVDLFKKWVPRLLEGPVPSVPQHGVRYFRKEPIPECVVRLSDEEERLVRAVTVSDKFYAKVEIGGRRFNLVPEDWMR